MFAPGMLTLPLPRTPISRELVSFRSFYAVFAIVAEPFSEFWLPAAVRLLTSSGLVPPWLLLRIGPV